jgi:metallo-beta-lactamase family protein
LQSLIHWTAKIQEVEAEKLNKGKYSKHEVAQPLYDVNKPKKSFLFKIVKLNESALDVEVSAILTRGTFIGACIKD